MTKVGNIEAKLLSSWTLPCPEVAEMGGGSVAVDNSIHIVDGEGGA